MRSASLVGLSSALLPGFPTPPASGSRLEALVRSLITDGLHRPILRTSDGVVWDGRMRLNACALAGVDPDFIVVADGETAALTGLIRRNTWTILERAAFVRLVYESPAKFAVETASPRAPAVSRWLGERLGWSRGLSPRQIEKYVELARMPVDARRRAANARTLHHALRLARDDLATPPPPRPAEMQAHEAPISQLALDLVEATESCGVISRPLLEQLRFVHRRLGQVLRHRQSA